MNQDLTVDNEEPGRTSPQLTPKKWKIIIEVLKGWSPQHEDGKYISIDQIDNEDEKKCIKANCKAHKGAYEWCKAYCLEKYTKNATQNECYRLCCKKCGRIALPMHQVLDVLSDAHNKTGHSGHDSTYGELRKDFYNIKQEFCLLFIKHCPVYNQKNVSEKPPGAKKQETNQVL